MWSLLCLKRVESGRPEEHQLKTETAGKKGEHVLFQQPWSLASSFLLKLPSEYNGMNFTKSTSRPLPYPCLPSNTIPFASKMRYTFSQVCPEVDGGGGGGGLSVFLCQCYCMLSTTEESGWLGAALIVLTQKGSNSTTNVERVYLRVWCSFKGWTRLAQYYWNYVYSSSSSSSSGQSVQPQIHFVLG